jgi:hypothetical protein
LSGRSGSNARTKGAENQGVCKLCKREAELLNSHVLTEVLYQPTYHHYDPKDPKKKRMLNMPSDPKRKLEWPQKGIKERLLCADCEQHLNRIGERYASGILKQMGALSIPPGQRRATITGVEYAPFKLFMMTQLWRAGVAGGEMWEKVRLGPQEEKLRTMLLNEDPGTPNQYACAITKVPASLGPLSRAVVPFGGAKYGGHHLYEFVARGHSWMFVASDRFKGFDEPDLILSESGDLPILLDLTGSLERHANMLIGQMQQQRRAREEDDV